VPTHGPIPQSKFLEGMGLQLRVDASVVRTASEEGKAAIREAGRRLVDPEGMGKEYMVFGIGGHVEKGGVWPFTV
jgi:NADH dehydrogenase [ubiquinone] 1 alpha subcomplex assembly factor 7